MSVETPPTALQQTIQMLHELNLPAHRVGYKQLCVIIPEYARDDTQSLTKTIYPYTARVLDYTDWRAIEYSVRDVIVDGWEHRNPEVWERYFPGCEKAPSNKRFIATLALRIQVKF